MYGTAAIRRVAPDSPDASTDSTDARPVRADVTTTATAGGVLVAVTLRNDTAVAVRVRVEPRRNRIRNTGRVRIGAFAGVTPPAVGRQGVGVDCRRRGDRIRWRGRPSERPNRVLDVVGLLRFVRVCGAEDVE